MNMLLRPEIRSDFVDQFARHKRKLRISVTDRCNFKCAYCMPEHPTWMQKKNLLSWDELYQFCDFMVRRGIEQIRITGGEPLLRRGVVQFIARLQALRCFGLKRISMTSNAHYLKAEAVVLKQAGLDDINISLDSLNPLQFKQLTQKDLQPVLAGIAAAQAAGLHIKINSVLIKGINDDQILPLAHWSIQQQLRLRFIEFMPLDGDQKWSRSQVVSEQEIIEQLQHDFQLEQHASLDATPARQYSMYVNGDRTSHPIGIISTITHSFCSRCDRIRLTAQGELYHCLFATQGLNIKNQIQQLHLQNIQHEQALDQHIATYIWHKKQGYDAIQRDLQQQLGVRKISMHMLGG